MGKEETEKVRIVYLDYLRVFATAAVILLHVAAQPFSSADIHSFEWMTFNFYDSIVRWSVPVFVMISGALFLEKECNLKKLYSKNILRLATAFAFWSVLYAILNSHGGKWKFVLECVKGHYHMWFIFMLTGLYMGIPVMKKITESSGITVYYLVFAFLFAYFIPSIVWTVNIFGNERMKELIKILNNDYVNMNMQLFLGYAGYFIAGFYINRTDIGKKARYIIYFMGVIGFIATFFLTWRSSVLLEKPVGGFYDNFKLNVLAEAIAVFVFFKYNNSAHSGIYSIVKKLAKYSFGVYLVHCMVLEQIYNQLGIASDSFYPLVFIPVLSLIVYGISLLISCILNHIPIMNKYIV